MMANFKKENETVFLLMAGPEDLMIEVVKNQFWIHMKSNTSRYSVKKQNLKRDMTR